MDTDPDLPATKQAWHRFLESFESQRGELYRYCRYLTRSPWDATDVEMILIRALREESQQCAGRQIA